MLVLSRKLGEGIIIAGIIRVRIVAVDHNRVRLGIVAPDEITVDREEIHERRKAFLATQHEITILDDILTFDIPGNGPRQENLDRE